MRKKPNLQEMIIDQLIKKINPQKYKDIEYKDSPDFQNEKVGLEITELSDQKHKEMRGNFRNLINNKGNKFKQYQNIRKNGGDILFDSALSTKKIKDADKLFEKEYEKKLSKLNNNYTLKNSNEIFFISDIKRHLTTEEKNNIINIIKLQNKNVPTSYDVVYILDEYNLLKYIKGTNEFTSKNVYLLCHKIIVDLLNNSGANK